MGGCGKPIHCGGQMNTRLPPFEMNKYPTFPMLKKLISVEFQDSLSRKNRISGFGLA
jgi:hypothetical protein